MKPIYEKVPQKLQKSFTARYIKRDSRPLLSQAWHFHPEIEICYTATSVGKRFVGNHISDYRENDLVVFGANLPHGFTTDTKCKQVVIQFDEKFMGSGFFSHPELEAVRKLIERSKQGVIFEGRTKEKSIKVIKKLMKSSGFKQMIYLFELLDILAESKKYELICTEEYALTLSEMNLKRVKVIYDYIILNFRKDVCVKEVAKLINLTETTFYKFIKKHTRKTFIQIVNEFRINYASKLLMTTDKTVAQVCFESGYNNVSYFNRKFKAIMHQSPNKFKHAYADK